MDLPVLVWKRSRETFARGFGFLTPMFMEILRVLVVHSEWLGGDNMWADNFRSHG